MPQTIVEYEAQIDRQEEQDTILEELVAINDYQQRYGWDFDQARRFRKECLEHGIKETKSPAVKADFEKRLSVI